ncbi:MAG TPA: DUF3313 family protein [Steroidobacteraceae bacterium]|nr:DUF3313 family protein [Steroidobacteraceae bacterium]
MRERARVLLLVLLGALVATGCRTTATQGVASRGAADAEGLVRVKVEGVQKVYARPHADLSAYDSVLLDPIEISFRKHWDPKPAGWPIGADEKQEIREGLARILRDEFTRELARSDRYRVVESPADNVLRIRAEIRDLYINAPDVLRPGIVRTYTISVGELTLVAELRDAPTGDLIARVIDHRRDPESPWLELTTRVENIAAARRAAARWATILREQLDAAHGARGGALTRRIGLNRNDLLRLHS